MPRADVLPERAAVVGQHPTQHDAFQRLLPSKQIVRRAAHRSVQTPMHVQFGNGVMQQRQIVRRQPETAQHQTAFQQRQHFIDLKPAFQQIQRLLQRVKQRLAAAEFHVRHRIRQSLRPALCLPEHRFDKRAVRLDVRRQNGNIVRLPVGMFVQNPQQLVFQNLQFAQGAVCRNDADGAVIQQIRAAVFRRHPQVLNVVLQAVQQRVV